MVSVRFRAASAGTWAANRSTCVFPFKALVEAIDSLAHMRVDRHGAPMIRRATSARAW
jgi:hypothetical protein